VRPWRLLLEGWPKEWIGFVSELPGCSVKGRNRDEVLARAPEAIAMHLAWLDAHDLPRPEGSGPEVRVAEEMAATAQGVGPLFHDDRQPMRLEEIEAVHRVGSAAVADLLALWERASEWERRTRSAPQAGWTPSEILRHVAELDRWYAARLSPAVSGMALPDDPAEAIRRADRAFIGVVRAWWSVWGETVVEREGEQWTVRKVLRRRTAHLREDAQQLAQWLGE
jgi:predicted RNase H-like HicB family nuclease